MGLLVKIIWWKSKPQPRIPKHLWGIKPLKLVFLAQIIYKSKPSYIQIIPSKKPCKKKPLELDYGEWAYHVIELKPRSLAWNVAIDFSRDRNINYQLSTFA
jgi:hypothetical protein